jgi:hypothetical protein
MTNSHFPKSFTPPQLQPNLMCSSFRTQLWVLTRAQALTLGFTLFQIPHSNTEKVTHNLTESPLVAN